MDAVRDWGTEELISKAVAAQDAAAAEQPTVESATPIEAAD